ncbi:odorant receptor Or2-like [Periplaneta americana]|uniref:odorant receptor Or2-like n=1 Tax=Periplaneta americana TaxID=6978 RepID=UPI0037E73274
MRIRRKNILRLLRFADSFIWEDLPPQDVATGNTSMGVLVRRLNSATKGFTIVFPIYYFLIYGSLILTSEKRVLTVDGWYPYDWTKSPAYEITIMIQVVNTLGLASILYAFPPLYATLVVIACSQLEKVRNILSNIKQQCILSEALTTVDKKLVFETPEKMFAYMQDQLNECIRLHQQIIRFMNELEDNFSTLFVGILLILMIALCFASFAAVLEMENPFNLSQTAGAYILYTVIIVMFCWFPSELSDQAQRVRDAAFACDWIGAPVSFQRSLSFMIACANKEFILTAGKCVPVSKETMVNMIQESMSLFMFLLHVRERDEDQG